NRGSYFQGNDDAGRLQPYLADDHRADPGDVAADPGLADRAAIGNILAAARPTLDRAIVIPVTQASTFYPRYDAPRRNALPRRSASSQRRLGKALFLRGILVT